MTPEEPPVGTTLTAPGARHLWTRDDAGWWVTNLAGVRLAEGAPAGRWEFETILATLRQLGGPLTVTTEYQVEYRGDDSSDRHRGRQILGGFRSREHVRSWADQMNRTSAAVLILAIRSQQVTRSAWTDEPLEDPK